MFWRRLQCRPQWSYKTCKTWYTPGCRRLVAKTRLGRYYLYPATNFHMFEMYYLLVRVKGKNHMVLACWESPGGIKPYGIDEEFYSEEDSASAILEKANEMLRGAWQKV